MVLRLRFSPFLGFVIVGSQQMTATFCDIGYGEDAAFVRRVLPALQSEGLVISHIVSKFRSMNCVQSFQLGIIYSSFEITIDS